MKKFDTIESNIFASNPYWQYIKDKYLMPNGKIGDYHYVRTLGSTMIIPIFNNKLILTKQFRYLNKKYSIEFPGGGIEKGLTPLDNARKELREELSFESDSMIEIAKFNPFNGVTDEICSVFLALDLSLVDSKQDESEEIEKIELSKTDFQDKIITNEIWDGMTLASYQYFQTTKYYKELL